MKLNYKRKTVEELKTLMTELKEKHEEVKNFYIKKRFPNRYKIFEQLDTFFREEGFTTIPRQDERYVEKGRLKIFNCPHFCNSIVFYKDNMTNDKTLRRFVAPTEWETNDVTKRDIKGFVNTVKEEYRSTWAELNSEK